MGNLSPVMISPLTRVACRQCKQATREALKKIINHKVDKVN